MNLFKFLTEASKLGFICRFRNIDDPGAVVELSRLDKILLSRVAPFSPFNMGLWGFRRGKPAKEPRKPSLSTPI